MSDYIDAPTTQRADTLADLREQLRSGDWICDEARDVCWCCADEESWLNGEDPLKRGRDQ